MGLVAPLITLALLAAVDARPWPELPTENATAELPAQEWSFQEGPRSIKAYVYYPGGSLENVTSDTGIFLSLHNWGGTNAMGTADPLFLAERYNVVAICVDYLQSGTYDDATSPPYDCGYLQALDALRALYWMFDGLGKGGVPFHKGRIYAAGGSGGGNVTHMANKLAPRTFAAIIDMCGRASLSDDLAFGLEGGSKLNAGYSQDPNSPEFLSRDAQLLRDAGNPTHLKEMKAYHPEAHIFIAHGIDDHSNLATDKRRVVRNMRTAGLRVTALFVEQKDVDGTVFKSTGHSLGDRTLIVKHMADAQLLPDSPNAAIRKCDTDFEQRDVICYTTPKGCWEISYEAGYPVGRLIVEN